MNSPLSLKLKIILHEHSSNYAKKTPKSFMQKHQTRRHHGEPGSYAARVTGSYTDCLSRQVSEGVRIRRCNVEVLNSKTEWHQPPLWRVQNEIYRGWNGLNLGSGVAQLSNKEPNMFCCLGVAKTGLRKTILKWVEMGCGKICKYEKKPVNFYCCGVKLVLYFHYLSIYV